MQINPSPLLGWVVGLVMAFIAMPGCSEEPALDAAPHSAHPEAHAVVLTYHHVSAETPASTSITPAQFEAQLDFIDTQGFEVWSLDEIVSAMQNGAAVPDNVVGISFDDAFESILTNAHPHLQARGWPYTVFVSSSDIDAGRKPYMSWAQLKQLAQQGVTLGNHTHSHGHLTAQQPGENEAQWRQRVKDDIATAQQRIEEQTGVDAHLFAYPYGEYNHALQALISELDLIGFGQHSGAIGPLSDFTALPRFPVGGNYTDLSRLRTTLETRPLYVAAQPKGPLVLTPESKLGAKPVLNLTIHPGPYNLAQLACYASGQGQMQLSKQQAAGTYRIQPKSAVQVGRTKYNCTAPHKTAAGVYYWWSYLIMKPHSDGSWYRG